MRRISLAAQIATLVVAGLALVLVLRSRVAQPKLGQRFKTFAMFRDGAGLPIGSHVVIAGIQVGEIDGLAIQDGLARVDMRLRNDVVIWDDAWAAKRATSLLGDSYIEILPGGPDDSGIAPAGAGAADAARHRLKSGDQILHVLESSSTDKTLRAITNAMPRVDSAMKAADTFITDARRWVSGPFTDQWKRADQWLDEDAIGRPIEAAAAGAIRLDDWTVNVADATADLQHRVLPGLDGVNDDLADATVAVARASVNIRDTLENARKRMDDVDPYLARVNAVLAEYNGTDGTAVEEQGALARMINDEDLGQRVTEATDSAKDFVTGLNGTRTWLGLRAEYNVLSGKPRVYVIAEVNTRNDSFYLIEAEKGGLGRYPKTTLSDELGSNVWTLRSEIDDGVRFSLMWGKRFFDGALRMRAGIKESTFGLGTDVDMWNKRLRVSADLFDAQFSHVPRLKLAASIAIFKYIYIEAGVDDVLNPGKDLPIAAWPAAQDVPRILDSLHYGRDYFIGATLNITDADLATMLRVYGALLLAGLAPSP